MCSPANFTPPQTRPPFILIIVRPVTGSTSLSLNEALGVNGHPALSLPLYLCLYILPGKAFRTSSVGTLRWLPCDIAGLDGAFAAGVVAVLANVNY